MFTKFISIGSYSPEVPAYGTLKNLLSHFTIVNTTEVFHFAKILLNALLYHYFNISN